MLNIYDRTMARDAYVSLPPSGQVAVSTVALAIATAAPQDIAVTLEDCTAVANLIFHGTYGFAVPHLAALAGAMAEHLVNG